MARTVRHVRHPDEVGKTLCGREATFRYRFIELESIASGDIPPFWSVCSRCEAAARRRGLIPPLAATQTTETGEINFEVDSGDKAHEDWLSRLGIQ